MPQNPPILTLSLLLLAALPGPAAAEVRGPVSPRVTELVSGLFCAPEDAGRRPAPGTMEGWVHVPADPIVLIAEGDEAPMVLGAGFGVRYHLQPGPPATVTYRVTHPAIPPTGMTVEVWDSQLPVLDQDAFFFQFDKPEEMVAGEWTFSASMGGEDLFTVAFEVRPAAELPALAHLCRTPDMLSLSRTDPSARG
jgi:hypothetical protein